MTQQVTSGDRLLGHRAPTMHCKQALATGSAQSLLGGVSLCAVSSANYKAFAPDRVTEYYDKTLPVAAGDEVPERRSRTTKTTCTTGLDKSFAQSLLGGVSLCAVSPTKTSAPDLVVECSTTSFTKMPAGHGR